MKVALFFLLNNLKSKKANKEGEEEENYFKLLKKIFNLFKASLNFSNAC